MSGVAPPACGATAQAWLARLAGQTDLLVADSDGAGQALANAVEMRRAGVAFYASVFLRDRREHVASSIAARLLEAQPDYDERCASFDRLAIEGLALDGRPQAEIFPDPNAVAALHDVVRLADGLVVRSWTEAYRHNLAFGHRPIPVRVVAPPDDRVPQVRVRSGGPVIVWAPDLDAAELGVIVLGLQELRREIAVVARGRLAAGLRGTVVDLQEASAVLDGAALVVDAATIDPGAALAFARNGVPLAVASISGAHEYVTNVGVYDPWSRRAVAGAALVALGHGRARIARVPSSAPVGVVPSPNRTVPRDPPLVSLLVRSHGGHPRVERALHSIRAQTYPRVEVVLVNDGGAPIEAIAAKFAVERVVTHAENRGCGASADSALRAASGEICALVDDDDAIFPDYAVRIANALGRSGAAAAWVESVTALVDPSPEGDRIEGYFLADAQVAEPRILLGHNVFWGSLRVAFRRAAALAAGGVSSDFDALEDYDLWLRLIRSHDFVRAAAYAALYSVRKDRSNTTYAFSGHYADLHRLLFARHPLEHRPLVEQARAECLAFLEEHRGWPLPRPEILFNPPLPFE